VTRLAGDGPVRAVIAQEYVTERKRAGVAMRESESVLRSSYDSVPMAMAVAEVRRDDVRFISANAPLARLLGHPPEGLEGSQASELASADGGARGVRWGEVTNEGKLAASLTSN
jgi:PAS domain-containing protein